MFWQYRFFYLKSNLFLLCLQRRHLRFVCVSGKTLSRNSNNVVLFTVPFHIPVQRPLKPAVFTLVCRMIMNHLEHHLLFVSSRYGSRCFQHLRNLYWSFLAPYVAFRLVPNLLDCPAWDTLLVAVLSPTWSSGLREIRSLFTMASWGILCRANERYREIIAVCSEIHTKHTNTLCGQNVEFVNVKLVVHIVTAGL